MEETRTTHLARLAAAAAAGVRDRLAPWYRAALAAGVPVADLQEATLQVFLFAGYPRTIDAFAALREALDDESPPPPVETGPEDLAARGRALFARIYGPHTGTVLARLETLHPEFARFVLRDAYGQVLGRPFLDVTERELMAVAMLAALGLRSQLRAHARGALRVGCAPAAVREALAAAEAAVGALPEAREIVEKALAAPGPERTG